MGGWRVGVTFRETYPTYPFPNLCFCRNLIILVLLYILNSIEYIHGMQHKVPYAANPKRKKKCTNRRVYL